MALLDNDNERLAASLDLAYISMIQKKYNDYAKRILKGYGFTPNEISTMIYLMEDNTVDTAKGISEKYGVTQSLICRSVDSLYKRGYLTVTTDRHDRRVNHLKLKLEDKKLIELLEDLNRSYLDHILGDLSDDEAESFRKVLRKIGQKIS